MNIIQLDKSDAQRLTQLRMKAYAYGKGFIAKPAALVWSKSDEESLILGIEHNKELIATMRLEIINSREIAEQKIESSLADLPLQFPVMVLSRAATLKQWSGSGLNAALRLQALKIAKAKGIRDILGTFVKGSPREHTLMEMGYEFYDNEIGWTSPNYLSLNSVRVVRLNLDKHFMQAQSVLQAKSLNFGSANYLNSEKVKLKFVESL